MRRLHPAVLAAGGFAVLSVLATWPLVIHLGNALPGDLGDPLLNAWILGWDADRLQHGLAGLWNAPIFFPYPRALAFSEHLFALAVPLAPIVWLTGNAVAAYDVGVLLTYVLAGTGMFLLARRLTHRNDAALIAGLAYAFGPARADQMAHLQVLASGWMPISLWALHEFSATLSTGALLVFSVAFVAQGLSNGYFLYFLALPVLVVALVEGMAHRELMSRRTLRVAVSLVCAAGGILLAIAPFAAAYLDVRRMYGFRRSYGDLINFSADLSSYLRVAGSVRLWRPWLAGDVSPERQLFPGLIAIVLAAAALWPSGARRNGGSPEGGSDTRRFAWCYGAIALIALVLSLGPEPAAWGHRVLPAGPYLWLTRVIPGLDGLRAPARLSVVVSLALSVLGAIGATRILTALSRPKAVTVAALLAAGIIAEGWAAPLPLAETDGMGRPADRPLYQWLAQRPQGGVLELPIREWDIAPTLTYQYATLFHHHPIVNGYSGYGSGLQAVLGGGASPLNDLDRMSAAVDMLRAIGVRYILVHPADYDDPAFGVETAARIRSLGAQLADARDFGTSVAFELTGFPQAAARDTDLIALPNDRFHATASRSPETIDQAFDHDRDTRWTTGQGQRGQEWIEMAFDRPVNVAGVRLQMAGRGSGDYPRGLTVDSIEAGGTIRRLRDGAVLVDFARGLVADGAYPIIDLALPPNNSTAIRLTQTGTAPGSYWSVYELQIVARPGQ